MSDVPSVTWGDLKTPVCLTYAGPLHVAGFPTEPNLCASCGHDLVAHQA